MATSFKWVTVGIFVGLILLLVVYLSMTQNINVKTASEIEFLDEVTSVGVLRGEMDENGVVMERHIDKDEVIANLALNVLGVQKDLPYDLLVEYVFYDREGNKTEVEKDIRSIQFRVAQVNKSGDVVSNAERRIALNTLGEL